MPSQRAADPRPDRTSATGTWRGKGEDSMSATETAADPSEGSRGDSSTSLEAIQRAQTIWSGQLVDLGGRYTLPYYKDLKVGTLDLGPSSAAEQMAVERLLVGLLAEKQLGQRGHPLAKSGGES